MAAIVTATVKPVVKPAAPPMIVERRTYNNNPMIVVYRQGTEKNFKGYAFNASATKVKQLMEMDKDGDSVLLELVKFAIDGGFPFDKAEHAVNKLAQQFAAYKEATGEVVSGINSEFTDPGE